MATSKDKTPGFVIPTMWEAHDIFHRIIFKRIKDSLFESDLEGGRVLVCISGVGRKAAAQAADNLVAAGAKELVSMGFCGALIPELKVGDLVTDRIISVDKPAKTPEERRALTERANAVAVDMETQAVIEAGTRRGVPIHILRVVSDELSDDLTPLFGNRDGGDFPLFISLFV